MINIIRLFTTNTNAAFIQRLNFLHNSTYWRKLVQFNLSDIGEGIAEVQLKEWHVKMGDQVNEFDEICAVQSDKASVTITSRYRGIIKKLYFQPDDIAKVGQPLVDIEIAEENEEKSTSTMGAAKDDENNKMDKTFGRKSALEHRKILASPAVRRLIREHGFNSTQIDGSGPNGQIVKEDIIKLVKGTGAVQPSILMKSLNFEMINGSTSSSSSSEDENNFDDKIVPIRGYSRAMIRTMTEALEIPHFGYGDEILADELVKARKELAQIGQRKGIKLSYMPFIIKATSMALGEFPVLNSSLDQKKENLIYKHSHNISFAMDTSDGLAVPNIKNCQKKNIWEIATEMNKLMERGREKRFTKEDLAGGTFTLSNIGSIGGIYMSPVILPPQVAIGAIGKIRKIPKLEDEGDEEYEPTVGTQNVMNIFWAADHRVIDGATMARFSNRIKQFLENPWIMLAQLR